MISKNKIILALLFCIGILLKLYIDRGVEISELNTQIALIKVELNDKDAAMREAWSSRAKALRDMVEVNYDNRELTNKLKNTSIQLEKMKSRENVALAKPKLVETIINRSYNEFQQEVSCVTGSSC